MNKYILIFLLIVSSTSIFGQVKDYELGMSQSAMFNRQGGFYDYSDPLTVNIKVAVWGFVRFPGRYVVPENSTVIDLLSYAGGPTDDSHLEDVRLYRVDKDGNQTLNKFSLNELLWEENLNGIKREVPDLNASDILVVPGSPRLYFKDWFSIALSVFSALISLSILIININKNN